MATDAEKNGIEKTCESDTPITIGSEKTSSEKTEIGSYFISNYPPFSQWKKENLSDVEAAMAQQPQRIVTSSTDGGLEPGAVNQGGAAIPERLLVVHHEHGEPIAFLGHMLRRVGPVRVCGLECHLDPCVVATLH